MIQKAFRSYISRKRLLLSKAQIRFELENELEEARSNRAQMRSIEYPTGISSSIATITSPHEDHDGNIRAITGQRKHTFSFGQGESKRQPHHVIGNNADGRIRILSGRKEQS